MFSLTIPGIYLFKIVYSIILNVHTSSILEICIILKKNYLILVITEKKTDNWISIYS